MELGMIGLGRMGANMAERLQNSGHKVIGYDRDPDTLASSIKRGMTVSDSLEDLIAQLAQPRKVWTMVPAGSPTEATISALTQLLSPGDILLEGGNANYKDSLRRSALLHRHGIEMIDIGTSGGIKGLTEGYSLMVGGSPSVVDSVVDIFKALAPSADTGWGHVGPSGAGHYVKMVHNAVEYGLMEAYAEGFELLESKTRFELDLRQISSIWNHGSVIRSRLLEFAAEALEEDPSLHDIQPYVEDTGEGRWAVEEAVELAVPIPVISMALQARFRSRQVQPFGFKLLAAMRQKFGGHSVKRN